MAEEASAQAMDVDDSANGGVAEARGSEAELEFWLRGLSDVHEKEQFLSPSVTLRGLPWRILAMPRPGTQPDRQRTLGFFLQCNAGNDSPNWSCSAKADLTLVAQAPDAQSISKRIMHTFHAKENDWGFATFVPWADLVNPEKGFIKDDTVLLKVKVNAEAPHGVAWDSKKHTGYVGLRNQGATCYMNSLLQTLYFTNKLRRAVYQMPTDNDDGFRSVPLALQRVFYELQFSDQAVGTKKLTRSFGWETLDSFMQHDVQELCRVLLDNIEDKMKGTVVEGTIPRLFEGKMLSYIRCLDVDYKSERVENFYDVQLNVKNVGNLIDSFKEYVSVETLDGDNKYDAGQHGLQRAEKGVKFVKLPPVLHLQLLRFQYDPLTDQNVKINERFEFPQLLELDQFLAQPEATPARYFLHAVLVHTGDNYGGHYVVYIDPRGDDCWCKFDDDVVSTVSVNDAVQQNFGGVDEELAIRSCTSAYMLVYIRLSDKQRVLAPVAACDIPEFLRGRLAREKNAELTRRREKQEAYLYADVQVFLDEDFHGWQGPEFFDVDQVQRRVYKFRRSEQLSEVVHQLAKHLGREPSETRAWQLTLKNPELRVAFVDTAEGAELHKIAHAGPCLLWLTDAFEFDKEKDLLVLLKFYSPTPQPYLSFLGHAVLPIDAALSDAEEVARRRAGLPEAAKLKVFEERKSLLELIGQQRSASIETCIESLADGSVLVFQLDEPAQLAAPLGCAKDFYRHLQQRLRVLFCDRDTPETFCLTLSQTATYSDMAKAVADYLQVSADYLQFFRPNGEMAGQALRCTFDGNLKDLVQVYTRDRTAHKVFYARLRVRVSDLESLRCFKVAWVSPRLREERELQVSPPKEATVAQLLEEVRRQLPKPPAGPLRLLEVSNCRITAEHPLELPVSKLLTKSLRAEEVPPDERDVAPDEQIIYVVHFSKDPYYQFGVPFTLKVREGEPFMALRSRVQKRLEVSDSEIDKWRFAIVGPRGHPTWIEDEEAAQVRLVRFKPEGATNVRPYLGLEHANKHVKRPRIAYSEKPIKIHN